MRIDEDERSAENLSERFWGEVVMGMSRDGKRARESEELGDVKGRSTRAGPRPRLRWLKRFERVETRAGSSRAVSSVSGEQPSVEVESRWRGKERHVLSKRGGVAARGRVNSVAFEEGTMESTCLHALLGRREPLPSATITPPLPRIGISHPLLFSRFSPRFGIPSRSTTK